VGYLKEWEQPGIKLLANAGEEEHDEAQKPERRFPMFILLMQI
jgi:hypothetical protein